MQAVVLDYGGEPYVFYLSYSAGYLYKTVRSGGVWTITAIDSSVSGWYYLSAAVVNGTPAAIYGKGTPASMFYGTYVGGSWSKSVFTANLKSAFAEPTLADVAGVPYVGYTEDPTGIVVAHLSGGGWTNDTIGTGIGVTVANVGGLPAAAYQRTSPSGAIVYAAYNGSSWVQTVVEVIGGSYGLALTTWDGQPLVVYGSFYTGAGLRWGLYSNSSETWSVDYLNSSQPSSMFPRFGEAACTEPVLAAFYRSTCLVYTFNGSWTEQYAHPFYTINNDYEVPCSATGVSDLPGVVYRRGSLGSEELWYVESSLP